MVEVTRLELATSRSLTTLKHPTTRINTRFLDLFPEYYPKKIKIRIANILSCCGYSSPIGWGYFGVVFTYYLCKIFHKTFVIILLKGVDNTIIWWYNYITKVRNGGHKNV